MTKTQTEFEVADITLSKKHPTKLTYDDLYTWVIWQFPKLKKDGLCGAVRPPIPDHQWYPAIIHLKEKKVDVYAHVDTEYDSPETASEHFNQNGKSPK